MNRTYPPIESVILSRGNRGMHLLAAHLPADYCALAAQAMWNRSARTLITTGFYVGGKPETDGPLGAFFLARALARCDNSVAFTAEDDTLALMTAMAESLWGENGTAPELKPFPIVAAAASKAHAAAIIEEWRPTLVVAIERCGRTESGRYLNMRGDNITSYTAQVDDLFVASGAVTVGVGDGGNEIGMGMLSQQISAELGTAEPSLTATGHLVAATVSNWGAYGLLAYLSLLAGTDLLPTEEEEAIALNILVENGCIAGVTNKCEPVVDGFSLEENQQVIRELRAAMRNA